ncbi:MAG: iron ABC transporter permease [Hydrogenibacillus schlegelii]|nr:iron ABC transporter permease [Hydrogenibacillus schlegelii]
MGVRWGLLAAAVTAIFIAPAAPLFWSLLAPPSEHWAFIVRHWLLADALTTLALAGVTAGLAAGLGTGLAWLYTAYDFPFRRGLGRLAPLSLAVPPYIAAFLYGDFLSFTGPVQSFLRDGLGLPPRAAYVHLPPAALAVGLYTLFLYPYVYWLVLGDLARQDGAVIESARLLGAGPGRTFVRVVVPMSRRAIVAGAFFVAFEVLGDYGLAAYLGLGTLSTGIFRAWYQLGDLRSAERIAAGFLLLLSGLVLAERALGRKRLPSVPRPRPIRPIPLRGGRAAGAVAAFLLPIAFGVLVPLYELGRLLRFAVQAGTVGSVVAPLRHTLALTVLGAVGIVALGTLLSVVGRHGPGRWTAVFPRIFLAAYAVPGAVIAIGVLGLAVPLRAHLPPAIGALLFGTPLLVLYAYHTRYLAVGVEAIGSAGARIGRSTVEAARLLGAGPLQAIWRVEFPQLRPAMGSAALVAAVELAKELPLTLLLRPFDFETLATAAFRYAADERLAQAALPSLVIVGLAMAATLGLRSGAGAEPPEARGGREEDGDGAGPAR